MTWIILIAALVVVLAIAAIMDLRSRRIRGHSLTMRLPSMMDRRAEARMRFSRRVVPSDFSKHRARLPSEDIPRAD